jgi:glycosyltransferase involved in cell wall biosynthesis
VLAYLTRLKNAVVTLECFFENPMNNHQPCTKKILYVITRSNLGGAQGHVLDLLRAFHSEYEVHLAVGETGALTDDASSLGVAVHILPNLTRNIQLLGDLQGLNQCINLVHQLQPDIIHAHSSKAGIIARLAGWACRVPTIFTAHGWGFSPGAPKLRRVIAFIVERTIALITNQIICVSESDRELALKLGVGHSSSVVTVHCGIAKDSTLQASPASQPMRLIMVARFSEQKDQATLLRALAYLADPSIHIDFVGSGPTLESCQNLAEELKINHQVSFLGDRRDVVNLLVRSQAFILSTNYEGFPISILEAMRVGLPIIASRVNGIPEQVDNGKTGLLVPPQDPVALSQAIQTLNTSPELRHSMGVAGQRRFEKEFTLEQMVNKTRIVYDHLTCKKIFTEYQVKSFCSQKRSSDINA